MFRRENLAMFSCSSVIRARVREVRNRGLEPTAVVDVKEVLKSSLVNIPKETQMLYYSSSCLCPPLTAGEEYIIMGYENEERSRYEWHSYNKSIIVDICGTWTHKDKTHCKFTLLLLCSSHSVFVL